MSDPRSTFAAADAALAFEGVSKSYGDVVAVDDVSFAVEPGEVFALLGPNGAGKTTLIRVLMDILRPSEGRVWLLGQPLRRSALDRVGYLPEERGLYNKLKVIDVMVYFGTLKGLRRADARSRALDWLERVELPQVASWRVERLSKGMTQKVQIAATLMSDPELCILDEPLSGLDPVNVRLVKGLIRERRTAGRTTVLSTHQMNMVEELCDRVAMIHRGRLMVYGEVEAVRRQFTAQEVAVWSRDELPEVPGVISRRSGERGATLLFLDESRDPAAVLRSLLDAGAVIERFEPVLASMEDVFVEVVRSSDLPSVTPEAIHAAAAGSLEGES